MQKDSNHTNAGKNSLIMGIIAIVLLFLPVGLLSLTSIVLGVLAIYEGNKVRKHDTYGLIGFILGIIHVILFVIVLILAFILTAYIYSLNF